MSLQKSFINGSLDEQSTFTLDFGMQEADSLRIYVKPRIGGTVTSSLFNVEINVCYIPGKYLKYLKKFVYVIYHKHFRVLFCYHSDITNILLKVILNTYQVKYRPRST
jgi:hypothetical protein